MLTYRDELAAVQMYMRLKCEPTVAILRVFRDSQLLFINDLESPTASGIRQSAILHALLEIRPFSIQYIIQISLSDIKA